LGSKDFSLLPDVKLPAIKAVRGVEDSAVPALKLMSIEALTTFDMLMWQAPHEEGRFTESDSQRRRETFIRSMKALYRNAENADAEEAKDSLTDWEITVLQAARMTRSEV
jgi:hypothetical protein